MDKNCPFTGKICLKQDCMLWLSFEDPGLQGTDDMCGIEKLIWDIQRIRIKAEQQ